MNLDIDLEEWNQNCTQTSVQMTPPLGDTTYQCTVHTSLYWTLILYLSELYGFPLKIQFKKLKMLAILLPKCKCIRKSQSNVRLPSSKSISDITVKPQALFNCCTYRNFTVFCSKYNFKSSKCSQYYYGGGCAFKNPNQMWGCQVLKALVILLWNHKHCSTTVPIGTLRFSAQNSI